MELSQPLGTERNKGRKATHDFLSLCSSSTAQQDPTPSPSLGNNCLKTHDFLQPLERTEKDGTAKEAINKPATKATEHVLNGGGGLVTSYSISYPTNQIRPLKQDHGTLFAAQQISGNIINTVRTEENSRTFSIWDESALIRKGKTGKENVTSDRGVLRGLNWSSSSSTSNLPHNAAVLGSFSASQPRKNHSSFVDMIASANNDLEDDDGDDDDVDDDEFVVKKEPTSHSKGSFGVKIEAKAMDQKPNTPRSKHSATEQRRRSKINDRFQKLREIIPNSDRKRDKASFLWEVIEHIQFLQEKVSRYEGSYDVWNNESSSKMMMQQWRNGHKAEGFMDRTRGLSNNIADRPTPTYVTTMSEDNGKNTANSDVNTPHLITTNSRDNKHQQQEKLTVESGTINISSVYSQGLLNTLTEALQSCGVDLSQARISVQIDLAKRSVGVSNSETYSANKDEGFGQALKRLKTSLSN